MSKLITWENVKNDLAKLWPNYIDVSGLTKLGYAGEEQLTMIIGLLVGADEVEIERKSKNSKEHLFRINYGSSEENLIMMMDTVQGLLSCISKRHLKSDTVTEAIASLVKFNRVTEDQIMKQYEKIKKGPRAIPGEGFGSRIFECLNSCMIIHKAKGIINRHTVLEDVIERKVGIPEERVAKLISSLVSRQLLQRINDASPACYKITPLGQIEYKKQFKALTGKAPK